MGSKRRRQSGRGDDATPPVPARGADGKLLAFAERIPAPVRGLAVGWLQGAMLGMYAGFLLLFGGIFLAVAWSIGPQPLIDSIHYRPFTGHASGQIVESWAALDFDPAVLPKGRLYWQPWAKIETCAVVEYGGDWGARLRRAFCGNRFAFRTDFDLESWDTLAPGVPFSFRRDRSGFMIQELRMTKGAFDWLSSHPPEDTFMLSKPPPATALGALKEQFDRPYAVAIASWTKPMPAFPLAYDPQHPEEAMPAPLVDQRRDAFSIGLMAVALLLCIPGILVWHLGIRFLFPGLGGYPLGFVTLLPLLALPWWSDVLPRIVGWANADWAEVVTDMLDDLSRTTRFNDSAPADAALADGERIVWQAGTGIYADTFGRLHFSEPIPPPANAAAALAALREQTAAQVARLDSAARTALFVKLRKLYDAFARNVQGVFTLAAENTVRDASVDSATRAAAKDYLVLASGGDYYQNQLDAIERAAVKQ